MAAVTSVTPTASKVPSLRLQRVVFTGWDHQSTTDELIPVARDYPHVEFGVLIARGEEGNNKYPTRSALLSLLDLRDRLHATPFNSLSAPATDIKTPFEVSCHICNDWAKELGEGSNDVFDKMGDILNRFPRIQINFARFLATANPAKLFPLLKARGNQEFVFQLPGFEHMHLVVAARAAGIKAFAFFDPSAGMGISPSGGWPTPPWTDSIIGFAGGLGPHNLKSALETIESLGMGLVPSHVRGTGTRHYWVDMETNVRTDGKFDLSKVRRCLEIAAPHMAIVPPLRLTRVVFTGLDDASLEMTLRRDDNTPAGVCRSSSWVEFGMLIARGEFGNAKYPTKDAITRMLDYRDKLESGSGDEKKQTFLLSCHICNDWAKELAEGNNDVFAQMGDILDRFPRVQLNFARFIAGYMNTAKMFPLLKARPAHQEFVFQLPSFDQLPLVMAAREAGINAFAFFDPSAGMGISPKDGWPTPPPCNWPVGFAGGLGPHNLCEALTTISRLDCAPLPSSCNASLLTSRFGTRQCWVDMETNVRTNGNFDIQKVITCVNIAKSFIHTS